LLALDDPVSFLNGGLDQELINRRAREPSRLFKPGPQIRGHSRRNALTLFLSQMGRHVSCALP
jgi:hypothetical protein